MKTKRAKPFPATGESEKMLTADGWTCTRVERCVPPGIKFDAFGFGDLLCCSRERGIMLVQCTGGTSSGNFNKRVAKIKAEPRHAIWLASGGRILVMSWEKRVDTKERALRTLEITPLIPPP